MPNNPDRQTLRKKVIALNQRKHEAPTSGSLRKKIHILVEFPHPELESIVVEWENMAPSIFVQVKRNSDEPLQFPGKRADWEQEKPAVSKEPAELSGILKNFIDPATGLRFSDYAFNVDIVFSARAFSLLQPEPDLVLPAQSLWECRAEALAEMKIRDAPNAFIKPLS
jgi:hypothetical protein